MTEAPPIVETDLDTAHISDPERSGKSASRKVFEWVRVLVVAAALAFGLRAYVVQTFYVPSGSMLPTLQVGDRIIVDRLPWSKSDIHRGDIIVFARVAADNDPTHPADLVKRVVGLPGETIYSKGDAIYISSTPNGVAHPISEPWLPDFNAQPQADLCGQTAFDIPKTTIGKNQYFVMGDCRGNSLDSRYWGTVPQSHIIGKVFLVVWRHNHPWFHWF
jgi:signal peptidase I